MKYRFPLVIPTVANRALLPAICAGALALAAALQLALTRDIALSEPDWTGARARGQLPAMAAIPAPARLREHSIFSPLRTAITSSDGRPTAAIAVAGVVTAAGRSFAIIQLPGGKVTRLPLGGRVAGMRLVALKSDHAEFIAQGKRISITFGTAAYSAAPQDETVEEEQE